MDHYAVIGNPVEHSLSPKLHQLFAQQTNQSIEYSKILAPLDQFKQTAESFLQQGGKGFNITLPFKHQAYQLADQLSERAQLAETVNTIKQLDNGKLYGDNTDGLGLVIDIEQNQHYPLKNKTICILGAGGATAGVIKPILDQQPKQLFIANRTKSKAISLCEKYQQNGNIKALGLDELTTITTDLLINATSASAHGEIIQLPENLLTNTGWCYEMMYGKQTAFLDWAAQQASGKAVDGLGMLVEQGAAAFALWRGIQPNTSLILKQLTQTLTS